VGHNGSVNDKPDHSAIEETDSKTKEKRPGVCPRYHGLLCEEHQKVSSDARSGAEDMPKVPDAKGVPNTWLILPSGDITEIKAEDKMVAKNMQDTLTVALKKLDPKPIAYKKWQDYNKSFTDGDKALEDGKWKVALAAYGKVDADAKKLSKGLSEKVKAKIAAANEKITARLEEIKAGTDDDATKAKALKALRADVGQKFTTGPLPVVATLDETVKALTPAAPPK
jgi:hypothetical protein